MKKIIVVISLLVMFMFLVSCAPQITDEELEAELAKLTPEEREALVKDLENEKGAFAGKAVAKAKNAKLVGVPKNKVLDILEKCTDSDGGHFPYLKGNTTGRVLGNYTAILPPPLFNIDLCQKLGVGACASNIVKATDACVISVEVIDGITNHREWHKEVVHDFGPDCNQEEFVEGQKYKDMDFLTVIGTSCYLVENYCWSSVDRDKYDDPNDNILVEGVIHDNYKGLINQEYQECSYGCSNGACLPAPTFDQIKK